MKPAVPSRSRSSLALSCFAISLLPACDGADDGARLLQEPGGATAVGSGGTLESGGSTMASGGSVSATGGVTAAIAGAPSSGGATPVGSIGGSSGGTSWGGTPSGGASSGGAPSSGGAGPDAGASGSGGSTARLGSGPGDWGPGDYPPDINAQTYLEISGVPGQGTRVRQYKVHVPPSYDKNVPTPLVFCIHGLAQDAVMFCVTGAAIPQKADQAGYIVVMPNGYQNSWNGGTCCGGASNERIDDVALFRAIFDEVKSHLNVDLGRVYATGLSNGAYMSYRLACGAADLFTAVAPGAGAIGTNDIGGGTNPASDFTTCEPTKPVSILDMHGTADPLIPYSLQAPSLAHFATKDQCGTTAAPAGNLPNAGDTTCVSYANCAGGVEVSGCSVQGGGHCWFGSPDCGTGGGAIGAAVVGANSNTLVDNDAVFAFFDRHMR